MSRWELNFLRGLQFETVAKKRVDDTGKEFGRKPAQQTIPALERTKFIYQSIALPRKRR